jgi:hypothetical protein
MLDRDETFAVGEPHVFGCHVVLEVDKAFAVCLDFENRGGVGIAGAGIDRWQVGCCVFRAGCGQAGFMAFRNGFCR